ncbi:MAG: hypothetical protein ACFFFG_03555 [Candidatus Thorarchaeota archaeon]
MGIEAGIKSIEEMTVAIIDAIRQIQNTSHQNLSIETIQSVEQLPILLRTLQSSLDEFQNTFTGATEETKKDLKFIKVSYLEDVVGPIRKLAQEIEATVTGSTGQIKNLYEVSVSNFVPISDKLEIIEGRLNALIENQTDQLAAVADLRDRVHAIIQVELVALKDRITIYLEASVNELKTSVTERLAMQDESLNKLTNIITQLTQTIAALPDLLSQAINNAVEEKVVAELASMKNDVRKMTAFIIKTQRDKES